MARHTLHVARHMTHFTLSFPRTSPKACDRCAVRVRGLGFEVWDLDFKFTFWNILNNATSVRAIPMLQEHSSAYLRVGVWGFEFGV